MPTPTSAEAFDAQALAESLAPLMGLPLTPEHMPGVIANLRATARAARLVLDWPLDDREKPAPVFEP